MTHPEPVVVQDSGVPEVEQASEAERALTTLRAYLEDIEMRFLQHEHSAIFEALGTIEAHVRGDQR